MQFRYGYYDLGQHDLELPEKLLKSKKPRLRLWNVRFKRYEDLALFPNLSEVKVLSYPLDSLAPFTALPVLRRLDICHLPKVVSLEPIAEMEQLEFLSLRILPSWAGKWHFVKSLEPLAGLKNLRHLELSGVISRDRDLSPLAGLSKLRTLDLSNGFPQAELARLSGQLPPKLRKDVLKPFIRFKGMNCRKCKTELVMLSGSDIRPKIICPTCKSKHFEKCVARFESLMQGDA